jgi:hypothetical protein
VSTIEELLERESRGSGLENREYGRRDTSRWPRGILYQQKFALTSLTNGGRSVGIVRSRTQAMEFSLGFLFMPWLYQFTVQATLAIPKYLHLYNRVPENGVHSAYELVFTACGYYS